MITPGMVWPPTVLAKVTERTRESQVWWEGDPAKLDDFYAAGGGRSNIGVFGQIREFFWGRQQHPTTQPSKKLHAPIAADIAKLSASELFSEPLTLIDPTGASQERADEIFNTPTFHGDLFTAGESASALGGSYQRVVWDDTAGVEHAWLDFVDVDMAIPEYEWGRLKAVTFWSELDSDNDQDVWRHFQRYEPGLIRHSLFKGTSTSVGREYPLEEKLSDLTITGTDDDGAFVETGVKELAAAYVPNVLPNPEWRTHNTLKHLGRADIRADLVPIFHSLDRIYSSLDRDFRVAQARMFASESLLSGAGPGQGVRLSEDQEVFTRVGNAIGKEGSMSSLFEFHQPAIRVLEHDQGADLLLRRVLSATGYSPFSFGMSDDVAATATETRAKKQLTVTTTEGKARYWAAALGPLATTCLRIDAIKFPGKGVSPAEELSIDWPQFARESDEAKARTVQAWSVAGAASNHTKVAYLHEDWDDQRVQEEVDRIREEAGTAPSPFEAFEPDQNPDPGAQPEPPIDEGATPEE